MSAYFSSSGGGGSPYFGGGGSSGAKKPAHHSLLGNLVHDAEHAATGIVPGIVGLVEHPVREVKAIGRSYGQMYGPLFHGDFGKFYANLHAHPLGPLLDALTIATLGAGSGAHLGSLVAQDGSRLAELGRSADLVVPSFEKQAGQGGADVVLRKSATNPFTRGRQVAINKALNRARPDIPLVGSQARLARSILRKSSRDGASILSKGYSFRQAFARLSSSEKAAWHLRMQHADPAAYAKLLEAGAVRDAKSTAAQMSRNLGEKKMQALYHNPSKRLSKALAEGHALSALMTAEKVGRGMVDPVAAEERAFLPLRVLSGAHYVEPSNALLGNPSAALIRQQSVVDRLQALHDRAVTKAEKEAERGAQTSPGETAKGVFGKAVVGQGRVIAATGSLRADRLGSALSVAKDRLIQMEDLAAKKTGPSGWVGGKDIAALKAELTARGEQFPSYVPHSAEAPKLRSQSWRAQGTNPPAKPGSAKLNRATLFGRGMLNIGNDALSIEHSRFARLVKRNDLNQALQEVAAKETEHGLAKGYVYLKKVSGEKTAPYTHRAAADLKSALKDNSEDKDSLWKRYTTTDANDPEIALDGEGHRLMVPERAARLLQFDAAPSRGLVQKVLYNKPTTVWKHLVLGLRPAYMTNIILSQHILGALQAPVTRGPIAYLNHLIPGARLGKLTDKTVEDVLPEQAHASFSQSAYTSGGQIQGVSHRLYQGVMPATLKAETWLRRLMIEGWAKSSPEIQAVLKRNGDDINAALREVAKSDPHVIDEISQRVDHAQGNYRSYSPAEDKLRQVIPFYGWDRHIVQSTYRILAERPGVANAGVKVGQQGQAKTLDELGALPTYLQGIVRLGGLPGFLGPLNGRTPAISTKAVGPFAADADILRTLSSFVSGRAGTSSEEVSNINPLLTALAEQITGRNVVTSSTIKDHLGFGLGNVPIRAILGLPQARLIESALGAHPLGKSKHPTSSDDFWTQMLTILGLPIKKIDLGAAHSVAATQGAPPR